MATIAEKSRTKEIIDRLQGIINNASPVPLASGKVMIYKDEVQSLLSELALQMETELKTYHEVNDRKGKIINEAKKEAEKIIYQAEHSASRMRVTKRATNVAPLDFDNLDEEELSALGNANEIYAASLIYTDEMLTEVTDMISDVYHNIRSDYEIILQVLDEKLNVLTNNKEELMNGLQEMEVEDRSQQILEIGQLLSNELYNERMKSKMASDEYEDGSVQLSLDLQEEQEEKTRLAEEEAQKASEALAQVMAERDALMATVVQMKQEGMKQTVKSVKAGGPVVTSSFLDKPKVAPSINPAVESKASAPNTSLDINASASLETAVTETQKNTPKFVNMIDDDVKDTTQKVSEIKETSAPVEDEEYEIVYVTEDELEEGEEYEIEYVDEDELEEGEEYEIEYVDEEEYEAQEDVEDEIEETQDVKENTDESYKDKEIQQPKEEINEPQEVKESKAIEEKADIDNIEMKDSEEAIEEVADSKEVVNSPKEEASVVNDTDVKEAIKELEELEKETEEIPIIPHFKKSEKIASAPSEKISKMAAAVTTKKEYSGLISRAVANREKQEAAVKVEEDFSDKKELDEDIKVDENGNEFVQATMKFDEDFEIMEF